MGRPLRAAVGGLVYHVLNRANARAQLFAEPCDYDAFVRVLAEAQTVQPLALLAYCVMPNHWHMVVAPPADGDLSRFVGWLTLTHTQRWHAYRGTTGSGHAYQGRFKSFPVETDEHFLTVCRYVERDAQRAGLAGRAEDWPWSSAWQRLRAPTAGHPTLSSWPVPCPADWLAWVNSPQKPQEEEAVRRCIRRGRPLGNAGWMEQTVKQLRQHGTLHDSGRPRKNRVDFHPSLFENGS